MKTKISDSQKKDSTDLASEVIGVLPVNNGGTNKTATTMVGNKKAFMRVNSTEDGYDFAGLFDTSATVTLVSGYNNDVVLPAGSNNIMVNGVFGKPAIITGIVSTGRHVGELITLRNNGATFLIAMAHLKETSALSSAIYPAGGTSADTAIHYIPVCRGQQVKLYRSGTGWYLMEATQLMYSIPFKKGVSYIQQAIAGVNTGYGSILVNGVGAAVQGNSTPTVGTNQSLSILTTGTTALGRASIFTGGGGQNAQQYALGNNYIETQFQFVMPVASTPTERFNVRLGLMNNSTAPTVGIWASHRDDENGGNWTFKCNNAGTVTVINSTQTASPGATLLFSIIWNGHEAKLLQNSATVATIPSATLNFPTTQGCTPIITIEKIVGITARTLYLAAFGLIRLETTL